MVGSPGMVAPLARRVAWKITALSRYSILPKRKQDFDASSLNDYLVMAITYHAVRPIRTRNGVLECYARC
jgi:hypothetical protein